MRRWAACLLLACPLAAAQSLDEALGGFDDTPVPMMRLPTGSDSRLPAGLHGSLALSSSWNTRDHSDATGRVNWQGLSKLRTRLNLQYDTAFADDWKIRLSGYTFYDAAYRLRGRSRYPDSVLKAYEDETDIQDAWLHGPLHDQADIRIGRQVVNWGRSDSLRVLDILNPLDNREPGLADIEDLRLPVGMIRLRAWQGPWTAALIAMPEIRFSKNPPLGHDFHTPVQLPSGQPVRIREDKPEDFRDSSWAASLTGTFSGWDLSFHAAYTWRDQPYLAPAPYNGKPLSTLAQSTFEHSRITLLGAGGNLTRGSWLYKWEAAWIDGIDYTTATPVTAVLPGLGPVMLSFPTGTHTSERLDVLLGAEYFGFRNTTLALEVVNRHIRDYQAGMGQFHERQNRMETALRLTRSLLRERLQLTALAIAFGERAQDGALIRLEAAYEWMDGLNLKAGLVSYQHGDMPPFSHIEANDRLFAELKYSF